MKIKLFMVVLLMVGLSACKKESTTDNNTFISSSKNFGVTLQPRPGKGDVKVKSKAQGWNKGGKKDGYVGYAPDESGWTFFGIKNEDMGDTCPVSGETEGAAWVITRLLLSATGDPATEKGTNFGNSQTAYPWLAEAFPNVDLSNGELFTATKEQGVTFLSMFNENGHQENGLPKERFIYYELTLTPCDDDDGPPLTTDPGWANGGRN